MANSRRAVVDLHPIDLDESRQQNPRPPENGAAYPADSLPGQGRIGGSPVRCISPEHAVAFHDAYEGDAEDRADVGALCARFDLPLPQQYR
jgi:lincosamide nucleotidyltransferase A/C/D/E